jgi:hypothetical protein
MLVFDSTKLSRHVSPAAAEPQKPHFLQPDQPCKVPTTTLWQKNFFNQIEGLRVSFYIQLLRELEN